MPEFSTADGLAAGRLAPEAYADNFADIHPPLDDHEAAVAASRCYFCHDAPCVTACPTAIDIPMFIRQISTGTPEAAARTIFDQNILGGMCARVCPTETLCEEACVRETAEGRPVEIGRLQRHATDRLMARPGHPYARAPETGRSVAVVGAGPAGLACAHRLAMQGHSVTLVEARAKPGGLNEYGIAAYKTVDDFAASEVDWLMGIGGITLETGRRIASPGDLDALLAAHDAVFLGMGLAGVNALGAEGDDRDGVRDAVGFIAGLRQADDLARLPVGRRVIVIGGGMTAVDAAVQSKLLGAEEVTLAYRRGRDAMRASHKEQEHALSRGVRLMTNLRPVAVHGNGAVRAVEFACTTEAEGRLADTGETLRLPADQVFRAIGQTLGEAPAPLALDGGRIAVDARGRTSRERVWAGGDCVAAGEDLTVTAVAQGRDAAEDIHARLMAGATADRETTA